MHDWTLISAIFEWREARATLIFRDTRSTEVTAIADGVVDFHILQNKPWGPSVSVNEFVGPSELPSGAKKITIEMQSGDEITIIARSIHLPRHP